MASARSAGEVVAPSRVAPAQLHEVARSARMAGPARPVSQPVPSAALRRDRARPGGPLATGERGGARPVRGGYAAPAARCSGARVSRRADVVARPAAGLRLTRRGRRLVAGLSVASAIGIALVTATTVAGDAHGDLQPVGVSSVVVRSGDTLWSIAVSVAPEEDARAVVDALVEVNDLEGVGLVPGQVLRLP